MTYARFLLVFLGVPIVALALAVRGRWRARHGWACGAMCGLAFVYTSPWDNHAAQVGLWSYDPQFAPPSHFVFYLPWEEYAFYFLQCVLTCLLAVALAGWLRPRGGRAVTGHGAYLRYELWWALPVILIQWLAAGRELWRRRRLLVATVALSTVYLGACDGFALRHGIWRVDPARVVGVYAGALPLEEFVFYFVTNVMAAQGFVLLVGFLRRGRAKGVSGAADGGYVEGEGEDV